MIELDIHPLKGVGPLQFGMTAQQVNGLLGPPDDVEADHDSDEIRELRRENGLHVVYKSNGMHLTELGFSRNISELSFNGEKLFCSPAQHALSILTNADGNPQYCLGFIILLKLGVTLTGFHDGDESKQAITVFEAGRWDSMQSRMKPFKM